MDKVRFYRILDIDSADEFQYYENLSALLEEDEYIEEKDYHSNSHYLAIKRWVIDAVTKTDTPQQQNKKNSNVFLQMIDDEVI